MKNKLNVFIIDDDKVFTLALKNSVENGFISKYDLQISTFEAGEQAGTYLNQFPDIAIVDYSLDSKFKDAMNGVQTIDLIKRKSPNTEIIMLTGNESVEIAMKAIHHGAHDYIIKNDTAFRKLNMALLQCIKLKEVKKEMQQQMKYGILVIIIITLIFGVLLAIQVIAPHIITA